MTIIPSVKTVRRAKARLARRFFVAMFILTLGFGAIVAVSPNALATKDTVGVPLAVGTPAPVILRIRKLFASAMYRLPSESSATSAGFATSSAG